MRFRFAWNHGTYHPLRPCGRCGYFRRRRAANAVRKSVTKLSNRPICARSSRMLSLGENHLLAANHRILHSGSGVKLLQMQPQGSEPQMSCSL
jgi:hypothetical protein